MVGGYRWRNQLEPQPRSEHNSAANYQQTENHAGGVVARPWCSAEGTVESQLLLKRRARPAFSTYLTRGHRELVVQLLHTETGAAGRCLRYITVALTG